MAKFELDKDGKQIPSIYSFEGLEQCSTNLLHDIIKRKRAELEEVTAERYKLIGTVLFYQEAIREVRGHA